MSLFARPESGKIRLHAPSLWRNRVKRTPLVILSLVAILACAVAAQAGPKGYLFIIGGERDAPLMKRYITLASGFGSGRIVVFTMASSVPQEVGPELLAEFKGNGAKDVVVYQLTHDEAMKPGSEKILGGAGGIWFSGGDQARLTAALLDTPIHKKLLELYETGCAIGGTSAGAAVMSEVMITGDEKRTAKEDELWQVIWGNDVVRVRGFGFVKAAVIDQHFVTRRRLNRLIATVIENPRLVGVGIDESTAVLVRPDGRYEVLGDNQVVIFDARRAKTFKSPTNRLGAHGMTMQVLLPGDVYDLARGKVLAR
jgi:cyanophycinase